MDIEPLNPKDGTPKHVYFSKTRPELLIEIRDKRKVTYAYRVRVGSKAIPLTESWQRIVEVLCRDIWHTDSKEVAKVLTDALPAFIKKYNIRTRVIEVVEPNQFPDK